jgi:putative ABC transport system ATP-binding protein
MLILENINLSFNESFNLKRKILNNLSLNVKESEFVVIIGENGAGKSTLFNVISGEIKPYSGKIFIDQEEITNKDQIYRSSLISKVMQDPRIGTIENMSVFENMVLASKRGKKRLLIPYYKKSIKEEFKDKLKILNMGLESFIDERIGDLSGGQRQAISMIMSILSDYKILLLDEITAALDPASSENIMNLAAKIVKEQQKTCIMITHNMNHAIRFGDRLLLLKNGNFIKEYGKEEKLKLKESDLMLEFS